MVYFKRIIVRILRLHNILFLILFTILLYILKYMTTMENPTFFESNVLRTQEAFQAGDLFVPQSFEKIDWHNYKQIEIEKDRKGIGELGKPAFLPASDDGLEQELYYVNGFNGALSDKIPLNRSLPDIRHRGCSDKKYLKSLPTVSVVVPFHNEHWSTLLRTAYSVLHRSPEHLIKEIFLVDDASTKVFLKSKLDDYLHENMPKVKVLRLEKRSGLITARLAGAKRATADVIIFLDSHSEANVNWLPPLLEPIALNYRTAVCPFIDVIAYDTLEYRAQDDGARGAFDWEFFYKRLPVLPKDLQNMPEPFESPVMAGGLFAISRKFFWELGGYDPGLDIWGGEQYELSFKIWQCGGRLLDAPCSRVGHIYRKFAPFPNPKHGDFVGKNYRRVAEVWMDEYARYLYQRRPQYLAIDPGDLTEQRAVRHKLHCKSFKWFMTQIAFDLTEKYPPVEPEPFAEGRIRPKSRPELCVDARGSVQRDVPDQHDQHDEHEQLMPTNQDAVKLDYCSLNPSDDQYFTFRSHKDIRSKSKGMCWDLPESEPRSKILFYSCHLGQGNQLWRYHQDTMQIKQGQNEYCLDFDKTTLDLFINNCQDDADTQRWTIDRLNPDMLSKWTALTRRITGPVERVED